MSNLSEKEGLKTIKIRAVGAAAVYKVAEGDDCPNDDWSLMGESVVFGRRLRSA